MMEMQDPLMDTEAKHLEKRKSIIKKVGDAYMNIYQDVASTHVMTKELEMEKDGMKYIKTHFESLSAYNADLYVFAQIDVKNFNNAEFRTITDKKDPVLNSGSRLSYPKLYDLNLNENGLFSDLESEFPFSIDMGNYLYYVDPLAKTYLFPYPKDGHELKYMKPKPKPQHFLDDNYTIPNWNQYVSSFVAVNFGPNQKKV